FWAFFGDLFDALVNHEIDGRARHAIAQVVELALHAIDLAADARELGLDLQHFLDRLRLLQNLLVTSQGAFEVVQHDGRVVELTAHVFGDDLPRGDIPQAFDVA